MKFQDDQGILEQNVLPSVTNLGLCRRSSWVLQQDNDPKHTAKNIQELLNPIKHLWKALKHAVCSRGVGQNTYGQIQKSH